VVLVNRNFRPGRKAPMVFIVVEADLDSLHLPSVGLTDADIARAGGYVFQRDRDRFLAARRWVQSQLAGFLGVPPDAGRLVATASGKPVYRAGNTTFGSFSYSRSGAAAALVIAAEGRIGIDIELVAPMADLDAVIDTSLTQTERQRLADQSPENRLSTFLTLWTAKEALLKATGQGIGFGLERIGLTHGPDGVFEIADDERLLPDGDWCARSVSLLPGYVAAIAADRALERLDLRIPSR
jgi:4'-phosphopantetheinyl transferase